MPQVVSCSLEAPGFQCPPGSHSALWETPSSAERPRPGCRMRAAQAVGLSEDPGEDGTKGPDCVLRCVGEWRKHETPGEETVDSGRGYLGRLPARDDTCAHHWAMAARSRWASAGSKPGCLLAAGQWVPSRAESLRAVPRTQCPSEPVVESPFLPGLAAAEEGGSGPSLSSTPCSRSHVPAQGHTGAQLGGRAVLGPSPLPGSGPAEGDTPAAAV